MPKNDPQPKDTYKNRHSGVLLRVVGRTRRTVTVERKRTLSGEWQRMVKPWKLTSFLRHNRFVPEAATDASQ